VSEGTRKSRVKGGNGLRPGRVRALVAPFLVLGVACGGDYEIERPIPFDERVISYPLELWDQDLEAEILLRVRVNDLGRVDSVVVVESSGHVAFDSAAVAGARDLRFTPARRNGKRIDVWAQVPVHFSKKPRASEPR
jgi:TonB family protein